MTALSLSIPEHGRRLADRVGVVEHLQIFVRFNFGSVEISARRMPHPTTSLAHLAYFVGYTPPTSVSPVPFFCCVATQRRIRTKSLGPDCHQVSYRCNASYKAVTQGRK